MTDVARGLIMVALAVLQATHGPLVAIVALAILATCFSTFFGPTIGSYLPSLVTDERELGPGQQRLVEPRQPGLRGRARRWPAC